MRDIEMFNLMQGVNSFSGLIEICFFEYKTIVDDFLHILFNYLQKLLLVVLGVQKKIKMEKNCYC